MRKLVSCATSLGLAALVALTGTARAEDSAAYLDSPEVAAVPACAVANLQDGYMRCNAWIVSDEAGSPKEFTDPAGFGATDLRAAYNMTKDGSSKTTVAVVDAFHYPTAEADLAVYRAQYGLPPCTSDNGCFRQRNQHGGTKHWTTVDVGWNQEAALDLDMVSAMCPNCRILFVEGNNNHSPNLGKAVQTAASMGAHVISNSYSGKEKWSPEIEHYYNQPGVAVTASSGDSGLGIGFPATSPHVIAVGGTALRKDASTKRGWTETAWAGAGSGCSKIYEKPSWQHDRHCAMRMETDVSAVASPATGVAVYAPNGRGSSSWLVFGGTSVSAPLIGGVFGANGGKVDYAKTLYKNHDDLNDVTTGSNGTCSTKHSYRCTARVGYDGPTGWGTPNGLGAFGD